MSLFEPPPEKVVLGRFSVEVTKRDPREPEPTDSYEVRVEKKAMRLSENTRNKSHAEFESVKRKRFTITKTNSSPLFDLTPMKTDSDKEIGLEPIPEDPFELILPPSPQQRPQSCHEDLLDLLMF